MKKKEWHPNFLKYMKKIIEHPNYKGLSIKQKENGEYSWIATKNDIIGKKRVEWAKLKASNLGIDSKNEHGIFAKVMFNIHPTKEKVCQICGKTMSLRYIYPNKNFVNFLIKNYNYSHNIFNSIYEIIYFFTNSYNFSEEQIKNIYISLFEKTKNALIEYKFLTLQDFITQIEIFSRNGSDKIKKLLSPGAMSNFPDRFDGFHSYNRCCRQNEDKGRSQENLKSYTKDRRAYEYWSDGNIHAANQYMGSSRFKNLSADHIGPISLGFIHDSNFIQPMLSNINSAKRDKLEENDFRKLIDLENNLKICPISWFSKKIWIFLKDQYYLNSLDFNKAQICLKINIVCFMEMLWIISNLKDNLGNLIGKKFLEKYYLEPKYENFLYNYTFNKNGNILSKERRNFTNATKKEIERFKRISFESIYDFHNKENRQTAITFYTKFYEDMRRLSKNIQNFYSNNLKYSPCSSFLISEFRLIVEKNQSFLMSEYYLK